MISLIVHSARDLPKVRPCYDHCCFFIAHLMILCTSLASFPFFSWLATSADSHATYIWHVVCNTTWLPLLPALSVSFPVWLPVCLSTSVFLSWLAIACLAASDLDFLYLSSGVWILFYSILWILSLPVLASFLYNFWLFFRNLLINFCYIPSSFLLICIFSKKVLPACANCSYSSGLKFF